MAANTSYLAAKGAKTAVNECEHPPAVLVSYLQCMPSTLSFYEGSSRAPFLLFRYFVALCGNFISRAFELVCALLFL